MFLLKKIVSPFLLPPGLFIIVLLASGLWLFSKKKCLLAGLVNIVLGASLWLMTILPVSDALVHGLSSDLVLPDHPRGDVIILLGGGMYENVEDLSGQGAPSEETTARIITAVRLQKKLNVPVIVSTGKVYPWEGSEAAIDGRILRDLGVPSSKILLEEKSRDTMENARYSKELCERRNFRRPLLVTSAYHMKRSLLSFQKVHLDVTPVPVNLRKERTRSYVWMDYLPGDPEHALQALREYLGLVFYSIAY